MANPRYNTQVANRRGAMNGGRMKKNGWWNDETTYDERRWQT